MQRSILAALPRSPRLSSRSILLECILLGSRGTEGARGQRKDTGRRGRHRGRCGRGIAGFCEAGGSHIHESIPVSWRMMAPAMVIPMIGGTNELVPRLVRSLRVAPGAMGTGTGCSGV